MKSIMKMVIVLSVLCAIAGFGLAYLKIQTASPIEEQKLTYVQGPAILGVFGKIDNSPIEDRESFSLEDGRTFTVFPAFQDGKITAVAIENFGKGYGGDIGVVVGFDLANDSIVGIGITTMRETPGLGTVIADPSFTDQFKAQKMPVALKSGGGQIDAIAGATISSAGTVLAVVEAGKVYTSIKNQILETWNNGEKHESFLQGIHKRSVE